MPTPGDGGSGTSQDDRLGPVRRGSLFGAGDTCSVARPFPFPRGPTARLTLEHSMNYVHGLFLLCRSWIMVRAVVEEATTLASLALFLGMIAIWAQVIATL